MAQQRALDDAIELLNGDHREIERLLAALVAASTAERSELVTALIRELNVHTTIEEAFVYPFMRAQLRDGDRLVNTAVAQHQRAAAALAALIQADPASPAFLKTLAALQRLVTEHVLDEERIMFPRLRHVDPVQSRTRRPQRPTTKAAPRPSPRRRRGGRTKEAPVAQRSSSPSRRPVHVVPHAGQWAVRREGASRVSSVHSTQAAAEKQGRAIAKRQKVEFELHGRDGEIRARDSYGHDPRSSKG